MVAAISTRFRRKDCVDFHAGAHCVGSQWRFYGSLGHLRRYNLLLLRNDRNRMGCRCSTAVFQYGQVEAVVPLAPSESSNLPRSRVRIITSLSVRLGRPSPEITTPTPRTPPIKTTPEAPSSEPQAKTKAKSRLGTAIVILFIFIGLGISTVYFLHRAFKEQREY